MPVQAQTRVNRSTGNGVTTVFPYSFRVLSKNHIRVTVDGVVKTVDTDYTVSGVGAANGGNVTFTSAPANATAVVLSGSAPYSRSTDYVRNGSFQEETVDADFDLAVILIQQLDERLGRGLSIPIDDATGTDVELPVAASRASKALVFDADGNVTVSADDYEDQLANVTAQADAAAASAAASSSSASAAASSASAASTSASTASTQASNASTSATNAATSASNAATSASAAQTAETNAETAETNAETALADALAIYGSIAAVQTAASDAAASASAAQTAETNAETAETNAETAETNAAASAAAALVSENAAEAAYNASIAIYGSLGAVQAAQAAADASASAAAGSATTATNQAAAAAASALSAASVVSQDLSAIDRTVFAASVVDAFVYDTEKDSDGGAWRHRCGHTSWEAETLSGNWLGSAANETAARAISGATTGSYYYDTTALGFYTLNAGSGKTATYRGNVRKFPAKVLITVETARVVLWDLTQANVPMWMVFSTTTGTMLYRNAGSCIAALNGIMAYGANGAQGAVSCVNFIRDSAIDRFSASEFAFKRYPFIGNISQRNGNTAGYFADSIAIASNTVNDVAMTVLPGAPVDVATGLPVPTIAVATAGGVSVIKDDGTVANSSVTTAMKSVAFDARRALYYGYASANGAVHANFYPEWLTTSFTGARYWGTPDLKNSASGNTPALIGGKTLAIGNAVDGLALLRVNHAKATSAVVADLKAFVTKDYNSGWLPGDIRGAWLADTVAETVTGTELVTNGTFATDTTGWSAGVGATIAAVAGELEVTATGAATSTGYQTLTTVVGKTYVLSGTFRAPAANTGVNMARARVYDVPALNTLLGSAYISGEDATTNFSITFTATATNTTLNLDVASSVAWGSVGDKAYFDNITCRLADVDRSVKAKGLQIFGSLTKAAVASGAALMGYSGFSAANYLEQPYNSDLDFGTGDFCIMGWAQVGALGTGFAMIERVSAVAAAGDWTFQWSAAGGLVVYVYDGAGYVNIGSVASGMAANVWLYVVFLRTGTTTRLYLNGVLVASSTSSLTVSSTSAKLAIGKNNTATGVKFALWRAGATAPSAEQIKHIHETERPMFEANAQCCLAGSSNSVLALSYDEETDLLHVGTSYGRSAFKGLARVSSEATPVGAITALAAGAGIVVQGGASGADVYVPAYTLREELLRDAEQMAKFGQNLIAHDFTATASQTTFTLPVGWEIVAVYQQGAIKRETTSWTRSFDGFKWSAVLGTGATVSDWISILAKRV